MTTATPIPASLATACAAHDRHRLDVLDALLDEAAPSAVRELLGAALDLCASLRADRDDLNDRLADMAGEIGGLERKLGERRTELTSAAESLSSERAHLAACRTRIAGLEQAADERAKEDKDRGARMDEIRAALGAHPFASDGHIADRIRALTARVAELEARPVLTVERLIDALLTLGVDGHAAAANANTVLRHLGPVTLPPAQDRAEELIRSILSERKVMMRGIGATLDDKLSDTWASKWINATRAALASLGAPPASPPAARPVFAGVSASDLDVAYIGGQRECHQRHQGAVRDCCRYAAVAAVLARLEVSLVVPVEPEAVARAYHDHKDAPAPEWDEVDIWRGRDQDEQRAATAAMRATLTAAGIPVTPEVDK